VFGKSETNVESEEYAREKTRKRRKVKQEGELKFLFSRFFASFRGQIPNFQTGSKKLFENYFLPAKYTKFTKN